MGRLKGNKGYFALLAGETLYSSIQLGLSLALINLPVAIIASLIDFGANALAGILMGPKIASIPPEISPFPEKKSPLQAVKSFGKKMFTYNKSCFLDPEYTVGASATGAGMTFFFQGALGLKTLLASHSITVIAGVLTVTGVSLPLGLGISGAMIGLGLLAIMNGNIEKWKGISKYYHRVFRNEAPPPTETPKFLKKIATNPVFNKVFNNPVAKVLKKALLVGMTVEASLFLMTNCASVIYHRGAELLASFTKNLPTIAPLVWSGVCCWRATWQLISAGRLALRNVFGKKAKKSKTKKSTAEKPVPVSALAANMTSFIKPLAGTFEKANTAVQNPSIIIPAKTGLRPAA